MYISTFEVVLVLRLLEVVEVLLKRSDGETSIREEGEGRGPLVIKQKSGIAKRERSCNTFILVSHILENSNERKRIVLRKL